MQKKIGIACVVSLCIGSLLLAGCGSSATTASTSSASMAPVNNAPGQANTSAGASKNTDNAQQYGPQYLVKTLQVSMEVTDTRQSASDLQQWISSSDPQATSDGINYQEVDQGQYNVTLTYLVDLAHYTQVGQYLRNYAGQNGNTLLSLQETVQDVTSDYVNTQASLDSLEAEQQRLLTFMNQAQNMTDTLNIEQQLTQVDGQIDTLQGHLNDLKGQTTYYTVTITLQPTGSAPPPPVTGPWSVIPIWQGAWSAVIGVWQLLASVLVWLLAFSVYIIPIVLVIWLVRKRPWHRASAVAASPHASNAPDLEPK